MSSLKDWINASNARGVFGRPSTDADARAVVERSTGEEFARALAEQFDIIITDVRNGSDPPDIVATMAGRPVSMELAELRRPTMGALWSEEELAGHVEALLDKKAARYAGWAVDALVLHTDEYWITGDLAARCVAARTWTPRVGIRSAWLLLFDDPHWPTEAWPLFRLYGDLEKG